MKFKSGQIVMSIKKINFSPKAVFNIVGNDRCGRGVITNINLYTFYAIWRSSLIFARKMVHCA